MPWIIKEPFVPTFCHIVGPGGSQSSHEILFLMPESGFSGKDTGMKWDNAHIILKVPLLLILTL